MVSHNSSPSFASNMGGLVLLVVVGAVVVVLASLFFVVVSKVVLFVVVGSVVVVVFGTIDGVEFDIVVVASDADSVRGSSSSSLC